MNDLPVSVYINMLIIKYGNQSGLFLEQTTHFE